MKLFSKKIITYLCLYLGGIFVTSADATKPIDLEEDVQISVAVPPVESPPLEIIVISDLNESYGSTTYGEPTRAAVQYIIDKKPDIVLVTGDMVAGQRKNLNYQAMWQSFHKAVTIPLRQHGIALAVTPGNHDASAYKAFSTERNIFVEEWLQYKPEVQFIDDSQYPLYYAFKMDDVLFVSLDDTIIESMNDIQFAWLSDILETPAKKRIVFGHLPLYPVAQGRETEYIKDSRLVSLFQQTHVDAFISGHHHSYFPGIQNQLQLVAVPCLGAGSRKLIGTEDVSAKGIVELTITDQEIVVEALNANNNFHVIPKDTLPYYIEHNDNVIWRDDIEVFSFISKN